MIRIQSLNKFYNKGNQNEIHVVNDVSLELPEKGMVAVFGKSGCGKTTLLNIIGGLDGYKSGSLTIEGQDIRQNTDELRNQYIGYIFQNYNLNNEESCFDNVADALRLCGMRDKDEIEERVMAALKNVDIEKYHARTPDTLSGGQQQRIAIARAIVKNPRIILADEPTGNLDEANTVMIMDLLKKIAADHLVLIVTHEANLVDYYCDTVVELSDGKVVNVRSNEAATGYVAKDKNHIYLGELEKSQLQDENAQVEYYGAAPETPIQLKIVNNGGKLYVQINTPKVQVLDAFSEVKLREGVFEERASTNSGSENIDMSLLPPVQGKQYGKLFHFKNSVKSGYNSNFKKGKIGKKLLRLCMCMFAAVLVLMTAVFGTVFEEIINVQNSYHHNVFYVYAPDEKAFQQLNAAVDAEESGIDYVRLNNGSAIHDGIYFRSGSFETFTGNPTRYVRAARLGESLLEDLTLVAGKKDNLAADEFVVTTKFAESLLDESFMSYIDDYEDVLSLAPGDYFDTGDLYRIAGVVRSDESNVYLSSMGMAKYTMDSISSRLLSASDYGIEVPQGEATLVMREEIMGDSAFIQIGEKITIHGLEVTVNNIISLPFNFDGADDFPDMYDYAYLLSDSDFVALSEQFLKNDPRFGGYYTDSVYTVIHSKDPRLTKEYLETQFAPYATYSAITTPDGLFNEQMEYIKEGVVIGIVALVVVLAIMSICMYFIMRSSLMSRIKEVGIYRAIGASRKNILFKFFIETLVLTTLTVFIGFLLMSGFIFLCSGISSGMSGIFFYPVWLALIVLVVLYAICLLCGILPVFTLLQKTPSEILAKYDI